MKIENELSLQHLVSTLVEGTRPAALKSKSFVENNTPPGLTVKADLQLISAVLSNLFNAVLTNAKDSCIKVSAKKYNDVVLIHIKDTNTANHYAVSSKLQSLQPIAEKLGGYVDVTSRRSHETTISFSFPNLPVMAA